MIPEHKIKFDLSTKGYTFIKNLSPNADLSELANTIGTPIIPGNGKVVQTLAPKALATPNTYSGIYGLGRFPFHTDLAHWRMPPRYLVLRCKIGFYDVQTLLIDSRDLVSSITPDILSRAILRPRRPRGGKYSLLHMYETIENEYCLRWDEVFIIPASRMGEIARERVLDWLQKSGAISVVLAEKNDTLILDNWRMLHSRSQIFAGRESRTIERVYLKELK